MNEYACQISLRVVHPKLSPKDICLAVGLSAKLQHYKGENRSTSTINPTPGVWADNFCSFEIPCPDQGQSTECMWQFLEKLSKSRDSIQKEIIATGGRVGIYLTAYPVDDGFGEIFSSELIHRLAEHGFFLAIEVV